MGSFALPMDFVGLELLVDVLASLQLLVLGVMEAKCFTELVFVERVYLEVRRPS